MKVGTYEIANKWLGLVMVGMIVIAILIILSIPKSCSTPPTTPQQVLNEALSVAQAPLLAQIETQKQQAAENDRKLSASQAKYATLVNQYIDLEKRKKDVKAPVTNTEIRDRFIALGYVPWPSASRADVTFDDSTASKMVVVLEQAKITEQQLLNQQDGNAELQKQLTIMQGTIKLYEDQIAVYKNMADMTKTMTDMKDKACVEQIKAVSPTFVQNLGKYFTGAGVGAVLTGLLIILL